MNLISGIVRFAAPAAKLAVAALLTFALVMPALAQTATAQLPEANAPRAIEKKPADETVRNPAIVNQANEEAVRQAIQPGNNAPVWREVRSGAGAYASIPGREVNVLVQEQGQEWRARRNGFWLVISGWLLVATLAVLAIAYVVMGTVRLEAPETGRRLLRFTRVERWVHWTVAITFSILAISGLVMLFGKNILLPIIGYTLFSMLAVLAKNLHNFLGPLFFVSVLVMFFTFLRNNWPRSWDLNWLIHLGGLIGKKHIPSGKYNAGEKLWFWGGVLVLGLVVSLSGLVLDFPNFDQTRQTMQTANIVHLIATSLFMAAGLGHIYLGTLGVAGAYKGMKTGVVDEEWAKEHHELWYDDIKAGRVDASLPGSRAIAAHPASGPAD